MTPYELAKGLALLPASLIVLLIAGLLLSLWRRRTGYALLWLATAAFYLASAPYTATRLAAWVESVPPLTDASAVTGAQAIVVLSAGGSANGGEYGGVTLDGDTLARLRQAAHLQRATGLPVLTSGGRVRGTGTSYAAAMKTALEQDFGVPVRWVEDRSRDTAENAAFSAAILAADEIGRIVLVTQAEHMARSAMLFRAAGLAVIPAPTGAVRVADELPRDLVPRMAAFEASGRAVYEILGQAWYRLSR
jgi:uncharacterized SAM-binding protein YcdF (DUF218 family)